jgi:hypothetical protein
MVRIDDRQSGLENILSMALQPLLADREVVVGRHAFQYGQRDTENIGM